MLIKAFAKQYNASADTIRFYEKLACTSHLSDNDSKKEWTPNRRPQTIIVCISYRLTAI